MNKLTTLWKDKQYGSLIRTFGFTGLVFLGTKVAQQYVPVENKPFVEVNHDHSCLNTCVYDDTLDFVTKEIPYSNDQYN